MWIIFLLMMRVIWKNRFIRLFSKEDNVFSEIRSELTSDQPTAYQDLRDEMKAYSSYIVNDMLADGTGILLDS